MPANAPTKLNALTSLRFVAAAAVVALHCSNRFGLPADMTADNRAPLYLGVSFFFVLSGFVLTYVYPELRTASDRGRFLLARFARIWPGHALAFVLVLVVAGQTPADLYRAGELGPWLAGLALVHSWVPLTAFYTAGNIPAWSVSTEFGFYLLFPLLIHRFDRTWHWKLLGCVLLAAGLVAVCQVRDLPHTAASGPTANGLLYVSPLARVFEFCLGMCAARLWAWLCPRVTLGRTRGTLLELAAVALVVANGYFLPDILAGVRRTGVRPAVVVWFTHGCVCLSFAALVVVAALERGWVTRFLALPSFVLLGDISYAVYLLHWPLLGYLWVHERAFALYPNWAVGLGFAVVLLGLSHLTWVLVETPARKFLVGLWPAPKAAAVPARRRSFPRLVPTRAALVVGLELAAVAVLVCACERRPYRVIPEADAVALCEQSRPGSRGVRFGDRFVLRGAVCEPMGRGLRVDLVWESCRPQPLDAVVVVSLSDPSGRAMGGPVYIQDTRKRGVAAGTVWVETMIIPLDRVQYACHHGMTNLAIGLASDDDLAPDRGPTDPTRRILLVKLL
jgi:peptidoglycan/LPS O-acetylase OafA/YrhL